MEKQRKHFYKLLYKKLYDRRDLLLHSIDVLMNNVSVNEDEKLDRVYELFHKVSQEELAIEAAHEFYKREVNLELLESQNGTDKEETKKEEK